MKRLDETLLDGTIETMVRAIQSANRIGVFDDNLFKQLSSTFVQAVSASLKMEMHKLPKDKQSTFKRFADELIKPVKRASDMGSFLKALSTIGIAKQNIIKRLQTEMLVENRFARFFDGLNKQLQKSKTAAQDWISDNRDRLIKTIQDFLTQWVDELISSVSHSLQKKGV